MYNRPWGVSGNVNRPSEINFALEIFRNGHTNNGKLIFQQIFLNFIKFCSLWHAFTQSRLNDAVRQRFPDLPFKTPNTLQDALYIGKQPFERIVYAFWQIFGKKTVNLCNPHWSLRQPMGPVRLPL